jgi:inosine-uridine nucleoside N-ribohydrolase
LTTPVLIDTDPGIDDALAMLLALSSPEVSVEAITTVAGNVTVERGTVNVFRILDVIRPARLPRVARGAGAPLTRPLVTAAHVHGEDGLGNIDRLRDPNGRPRYPDPVAKVEMRDGPDLILETAEKHPGELVIVALGPLTNLALALKRDAGRLRLARRIVVMGGAVTVAGNITPAAEFNLYVDPEAAAAVFEAGLPIELIPLDVTRQVLLTRAALTEAVSRAPGRRARFLEDFSRFGFDFADAHGDGGIVLHDPLAVAAAVAPELVRLEPFHVDIECEGTHTRGMTVADRRSLAPARKKSPNCRAALGVDVEAALQLFLERVCRTSA